MANSPIRLTLMVLAALTLVGVAWAAVTGSSSPSTTTTTVAPLAATLPTAPPPPSTIPATTSIPATSTSITTTTVAATTTTVAPTTTVHVDPTTTTTAHTHTTTTTTIEHTHTTTTTTVPSGWGDPPDSILLTRAEVTAIVSKYFKPEDVELAVGTARCESGYIDSSGVNHWDAAAVHPSGTVVGLFQHVLTAWDSRAAAAGFPGEPWWNADANAAAAALLWYDSLGPAHHWPNCYPWAVDNWS